MPTKHRAYSTVVVFVAVLATAFPSAGAPDTTPARAGQVYYLSPHGSDSRSGFTPDAAWKTFAHAIPMLRPGDTLVLRDGTYDGSNSGYPSIDGGSNASNGTAAQPITLKAENERKAFIQNRTDRSPGTLTIRSCSYWTIEGLRLEGDDIKGESESEFYPVAVYSSDHIILRRMLVAKTNRYANGHGIYLEHATDSLLEENEIYNFHRHGILLRNDRPGRNVLRRNYTNSRDHADIPGGQDTSGIDGTKGDGGIRLYPSPGNILENNVCESSSFGIAVIAAG